MTCTRSGPASDFEVEQRLSFAIQCRAEHANATLLVAPWRGLSLLCCEIVGASFVQRRLLSGSFREWRRVPHVHEQVGAHTNAEPAKTKHTGQKAGPLYGGWLAGLRHGRAASARGQLSPQAKGPSFCGEIFPIISTAHGRWCRTVSEDE